MNGWNWFFIGAGVALALSNTGNWLRETDAIERGYIIMQGDKFRLERGE